VDPQHPVLLARAHRICACGNRLQNHLLLPGLYDVMAFIGAASSHGESVPRFGCRVRSGPPRPPFTQQRPVCLKQASASSALMEAESGARASQKSAGAE
jgi:hypothetical protein